MLIWRSWNVRSFLGWKYWWTRVAVVGLVAASFQAILSRDGAFSVYLVCVWGLGIATFMLVFAHLLARVIERPVEAVLAGCQSWLPIFWVIPLIDGIVHTWIPAWNTTSLWWFAPAQSFSRFLLPGCSVAGCSSLGFALFSVLIAFVMGWIARAFGATYAKAIGLGMGGYVLFWGALSVLSVTAWPRLSVYGTTLASPTLVVEQAFLRTWNDTLWLDARERFWTLPTVGHQGARVLIGGIFLWLSAFALLAPLLERSPAIPGRWFRRWSQGALIWPVLLAGMFLGMRSGTASSWVAGAITTFFYGAVAIATGKALLVTAEGREDDQAWVIRLLALVGAWWLGWPTGLFVGLALLARFYTRDASWYGHILGEAGSAWCLLVAAWTVFARSDTGSLPLGPFFGVFLFLLMQAIWLEYAPNSGTPEGAEVQEGISSWKHLLFKKTTLFGGWVGALVLLWALVGSLSFGWFVIAFSAILASVLWLFPNLEKNAVYLAWFGTILVGMLLHGGFFLS